MNYNWFSYISIISFRFYIINSVVKMSLVPIKIDKILKELILLGEKIYSKGYVVGNGGNISSLVEDEWILIKKSGMSMESLIPKNFILSKISNKIIKEASIDYKIHREIYLNTNSKYILHAHPTNTVLYTLNSQKEYLVPIDFETKYHFKKRVPILDIPHNKIHRKIGVLSKSNEVIIEKGHGVYIHGKSTKDILFNLERIEHASHLLLQSSTP